MVFTKTSFSKYSPIFYWSVAFAVLAPLVAAFILIWNGQTRVADFRVYHRHIGKTAIDLLAVEITNVIAEKQRLVQVFSRIHSGLIQKVADHPDDDALRHSLHLQLEEFFPTMFSFTIANNEGVPYLDDFDGLIGDVCLTDIRKMAHTDDYSTRIHPNPIAYHYDIITHWGDKGIFFVSFRPEIISRLLVAASPAGHELQLVVKDREYLLEIDEHGSRDKTPRLDYRMDKQDRNRILNMVKVAGTEWDLLDLYEPRLFEDFSHNIYSGYSIIIGIFILISVSVILLMSYFERQRIASEKLRDEMQAILSHDLRSPLLSISGAVSLLDGSFGTIDADQSRKLLTATSINITNMQRIVDEIVDINRLETGKMNFDFTQIDLDTFMQEAAELNRSYAEQFSVSIKLQPTTTGAILNGDKGRLHQVMTNLLSNAIKYSPEGGDVQMGYEVKNREAVIYVKDDGPGIPLAFQPHVFEKFAQDKSKLKTMIPSSGLGLAISKHILEAHAAQIEFISNETNGTTFFVNIPVS